MERTRKDNDVILSYFLKNRQFRKLTITAVELLKGLNTINVLYLPPKSILFECGQKGEHFYVVLGGQCELYMKHE